jgi:protein SCO1/2
MSGITRRGLALAGASLAFSRGTRAEDCEAREREYFGNAVLTDQEGKPRRFYEDVLRGHTVLVGWIFTSCPDACPLLAARSLQIVDAATAPVRLVHLTTDPRRDTPARLKSWAARFGSYKDWLLLTGAPAELREVARRLGQQVDEANPDRHTTLMLAGNVPARRWAKIRPDATPQAAAMQIADLAAAPSLVAGCAG